MEHSYNPKNRSTENRLSIVIILLGLLALFLYLTRNAAKDPQKRYDYYLYLLVDGVLASAFIYLIVTAVLH